MKDTEATTNEWKPNRKSLPRIPATERAFKWLSEASKQALAAYQAGSTPEEVLDLLEKQGWERTELSPGKTTYFNAFSTFQVDGSRQIRLTVTFTSSNQFSAELIEFWR